MDVSNSALKLAKRKIMNYLKTRVGFEYLDILDEDKWHFDEEFDLIISNPPYIPNKEKALMHANVLDFEPHLALFVEDDNALVFYDKIANFALLNLKKGGYLFFECNEYNATDVRQMLKEKEFVKVELVKDLSGKK